MQNLTFADLIKAVIRRPFWFLLPLVLCIAAAWGTFRVLPRIYRASTLVMVERQKVPADYVKATVTSDMDERLKTLEQQITNRDNLERVIREMNLYPELRGKEPIEDVVSQMREHDLAAERQGDVFRIYYRNGNPQTAAAVANRIAELFIQANLQLRENQAQGTSTFLETELNNTKVKLEQQEAKIAAFKQHYMGQLPEQRDTNLQGVNQLQAKLEINMDALDKAETRKIYLQRQISELQLQAPDSPLAASRGPAGPAAPSHLDQLRSQLLDLRSRYTDKHPDVIRTESEIARLEALEKKAAAANEAAAATAAASPAPLAPPARSRVDPALRSQLDGVDLEIRNLQAERQRILDDTSRYQARLENVPRVEQELLSLSRDYDNIKKSYDELLAKRIEARLAENLEKSRQGEQFNILEKALPPTEPYSPNPLVFLAGGLVLGALTGLGSALLRDQTDATYGDAEALQGAFPGVRVLASIPVFQSTDTAGFRASAARFGRA